MRKISTLFAVLMIVAGANAKTYTLGSGKWSDVAVWNGQYIGNTIGAAVVVKDSGQ